MCEVAPDPKANKHTHTDTRDDPPETETVITDQQQSVTESEV